MNALFTAARARATPLSTAMARRAYSAPAGAKQLRPAWAESHHSAAHLHEEVELWKKVSAGGTVVVALCLLNFLAAEHQHFDKPPPFPYLRIRNKPFPWGDGSADLMDVRHEYHDPHHH